MTTQQTKLRARRDPLASTAVTSAARPSISGDSVVLSNIASERGGEALRGRSDEPATIAIPQQQQQSTKPVVASYPFTDIADYTPGKHSFHFVPIPFDASPAEVDRIHGRKPAEMRDAFERDLLTQEASEWAESGGEKKRINISVQCLSHRVQP